MADPVMQHISKQMLLAAADNLAAMKAERDGLLDSLNDCVRLLLGHVSGPAQRDGIIREAIERLGDRYSGPSEPPEV